MNLSGGSSGASASAGPAANAAMSVMKAFMSLHIPRERPPNRKLSGVHVGLNRGGQHIDTPRRTRNLLGLASLEA
ncbi:hypothetical protein NIPOLPBK_01614 [Stenotrophomonas maltophilia]|nr:hypothetical protein NIPOLPBK_01614 [Stenotrophomonas maltophilia]QNG80849.1 hypothetical protein FLFIOBJN_00833 [Stenotrophomonas maltophilia]